MTREKAIEFGEFWLEMNIDGKDSLTYQFFEMSVKALKQEDILDRVQEKINKLLKEPDYQHEGEDWKTGLIMAEELIADSLTIVESEV